MRTLKDDEQYNELVKLYREMAVFCARAMPERLDQVRGDTILDVRADLLALCGYVDAVIEQTADYVEARTGVTIDGASKIGVLRDAIDGDLLREIRDAAKEVAQ